MRHIRKRVMAGFCTQETHCGEAATTEDVWPADAFRATREGWSGLCAQCAVLVEFTRQAEISVSKSKR